MSLRIIEPISITNSFKMPAVKEAWSAYLPQTRRYVIEINRSLCSRLLIPATEWEVEHRRYGCVGTAYDYAVGLIWAGIPSSSFFSKLRNHYSKHRSPGTLLDPIEELVMTELSAIRAGKIQERQRDFFRGLGLLADLKGLRHVSGRFLKQDTGPIEGIRKRFISSLNPAISWIYSAKVQNLNSLRHMLREHYPSEFVDELQQLLKATTKDLPKARPVVYNPIFGNMVAGVSIGADGDLLIRDLLLELKTVTKGFDFVHLWQLLGYAALDANLGNHRIRRVGLYNPRYRALWIKPLDDLTRKLGDTSFNQLCCWFNSTVVKAL